MNLKSMASLAAVGIGLLATDGRAQTVTGASASNSTASSAADTSAGSGTGMGMIPTYGVPAIVGRPWSWRGYPFYYDPFDWGYGYGRVAQPTTIIVVQPRPLVPLGFDPFGGAAQRPAPPRVANRPAVEETGRADRLTTLGDRYFRAGNWKRATDRYEQAVQALPTAAGPRIRLAQVAIARGDFTEAAHRIREAVVAEPGWIARAPDITPLFADPDGLAASIEKLAAHLETRPNDRDARLALGTQRFLAGQTREAGEEFLRLADRRGDPALEALLHVTEPRAAR